MDESGHICVVLILGSRWSMFYKQVPFTRIISNLDFFFSIGKDLVAAKNLLNRHEVILADIASHEPRIRVITERGNKMVEEGTCDPDWFAQNLTMTDLGEEMLIILVLKVSLKIDAITFQFNKFPLSVSDRAVFIVFLQSFCKRCSNTFENYLLHIQIH